jgi:2-dehydropantoate 2-reductase
VTAGDREPVAIIGPGSIGATMAACLHGAGTPLVLCGRTSRPQLVVVSDEGWTRTVPGPVQTAPDTVDGPLGTVLLAVKATQVADAAPWLERLCGPETVVCVLQNGIEHHELVAPLAPAATLVPCVVWCPAEGGADGVVRLRGAPRLTVPADAGGRAIAAVFAGSACEIELSDDFHSVAWRKLCANALAGMMVLAGRRAGMFRRDDVAALALAYLDECAAVGRADGADLAAELGQQILARLQAAPEDLGSSILFDHEAGRPLEWKIRNEVIVRRARLHGVATPIGEVLVPLLAAASV